MAVSLAACSSGDDARLIEGRVLGSDGEPVAAGRITASVFHRPAGLEGSFARSAFDSARLDQDGRFQMAVDTTVPVVLEIRAVNHHLYQTLIWPEKTDPVRFTARLASYRSLPSYEHVGVVGSFNSYVTGARIPLAKEADGTYAATIPAPADTVAYQIVSGALGARLAPIGANSYRYASDNIMGRFAGVVSARDKDSIRVTFDPNQHSYGDTTGSITFHTGSKRQRQLADAYETAVNLQWEFIADQSMYRHKHHSMDRFATDWKMHMQSQAARIGQASDSLVTDARYAAYLAMAQMDAPLDTNRVQQALEVIDPSSPAWSFSGFYPMALFEAVQAAGGPAEHTAYLKTVAHEHPSDFLRAGSLFELARWAQSEDEKEQFRRYRGRLLSQYPQSFHADRANEAFSENQRPGIDAGQLVPSFRVSAIGEEASVITPDSLEGSPYLIDFWASWCGPCLMEMDALHTVHERYEPQGLRMLSISLDESPVPVREIRGARWPMPWIHGIAPRGFASEVARTFGVSGVPTHVLVDKTGTITYIESGSLSEATLDSLVQTVL